MMLLFILNIDFTVNKVIYTVFTVTIMYFTVN
ncbi:hypothetical protein MCETHM1_03294 [Flavobacteriaceae bacterium]